MKKLASCLWGFAEATLFFILPDVLLSYFALHKKEPLFKLTLWALGGAIAGGVLMYSWGTLSPETSWTWVEAVPAINVELMNKVAEQMGNSGATAIILGPFQGLPYKTYAVQAFSADIGIVLFVIVSIVARLLRFVLIAYVVRGISHLLMTKLGLSRKALVIVWFTAWTSVYMLYFRHFPS